MRPSADPAPGAAAIGPILPLFGSIISLCIGTSFAKSLFPIAGPTGMTALRLGLAALLMAAVQRPWRWRFGREAAVAVVGYGIVLGLMNLCFYAAFSRLPLGVAIAIEFLGPLGVAIWYSARATDFIWIALAGGGVAFLVLPSTGSAPIDPIGVGYALAAALFWALYILWGKRASELLPERQIVCLGMCIAAMIAVPIGVIQAGTVLLQPTILATGCVVALMCSAIPYSLEMFALKRLSRHVFGVLLSLEPAVGALAALVILHERLGAAQWLAIVAIMIASGGSALSGQRSIGPPLPLG